MESSNKRLVEYLVSMGYADARVANAMLSVDRKLFVPVQLESQAYHDCPLPIGFGQTISAPSIVAVMSKELDVRDGMRVLEVGAGSGYHAAILSQLVGEKGAVFSVERIPEIAELAKQNLSRIGCKNVEIVVGDGTKGYSQKAPFDRIIVTAAAPSIPAPLVEQLKEDGKFIIPVGSTPYWQDLVLLEKKHGEITQRNLLPVMFVPLIGEYGFNFIGGKSPSVREGMRAETFYIPHNLFLCVNLQT